MILWSNLLLGISAIILFAFVVIIPMIIIYHWMKSRKIKKFAEKNKDEIMKGGIDNGKEDRTGFGRSESRVDETVEAVGGEGVGGGREEQRGEQGRMEEEVVGRWRV